MKTKIEIEFNTSKMHKVLEIEDGTDKDITSHIEKKLHDALLKYIEQINDPNSVMFEDFENKLRDGKLDQELMIEDCDTLMDYCDGSISVSRVGGIENDTY